MPARLCATRDASAWLKAGRTRPTPDSEMLVEWMSGNATSDSLIRAGAPSDWTVADKSGGAGGIRNHVAIVTPPNGAPIIISVLTAKNDPAAEYDDELVPRAARAVLEIYERASMP